jgi:hypothetical protein
MSKYYYLVAGLPNISFDDSKPPYAATVFKDELRDYLTGVDMRLLSIFILAVDNRNLLKLLQNPGFESEPDGNFLGADIEELIVGIESEREEEKPFVNRNKRLPAYFEAFARAFIEEKEKAKEREKAEPTLIPWEDRLSTLYYDYAMNCGCPFVAAWFELNLNINNILAALVCRKYKLDRANYIVGSTDTAGKLRTSNARDFDLGDSLEYLPAVMRIAEEPDMLQRERRTDLLKWEWLDLQTLVRIFDVDSLLAYLLKLQIMERWAALDKSTGEQRFRGLVGAMKRGSDNALEEFKRNNKK